jgi:hypothetical protein
LSFSLVVSEQQADGTDSGLFCKNPIYKKKEGAEAPSRLLVVIPVIFVVTIIVVTVVTIVVVITLLIGESVQAVPADAGVTAQGDNCATGAAHIELPPCFGAIIGAAPCFVTAAGIVFTHGHRRSPFWVSEQQVDGTGSG